MSPLPSPTRPPAPYRAPAPYSPPRTYAKPSGYKEPEYPPQPYQYNYGVRDEYTGADFDKAEEQDAYGNLQGEYRVQLPDGRTQIVRYSAGESGYEADVSYEGQAQYPPEPAEGYGNTYKVAPKYTAHGGGYKRPAPKYAPTKYAPAPVKYAPAAPSYKEPAPSYKDPEPSYTS